MTFFTRFAILFYLAVISVVGLVVIGVATHFFLLEDIYYFVQFAYNDSTFGFYVVIISLAIIIVSLIFARIIIGKGQKSRTIAFDNPSGRVSISLGAVEDLVRRLIYKIPEIKDVKSNISATKHGMEIEAYLTLKEDVHIPDMTSRLQELIKSKIQEILGLEETVTVRIHIAKIMSDQSRSKHDKDNRDAGEEPTVPFQGYRN